MTSNIFNEAKNFIESFYKESNKTKEDFENRISQIESQLMEQGFYEHTSEEIEYGAKVAWRNSNRCIGRLFWDSLKVIDKRSLDTEEKIVKSLFEHIEYATNGGRIRPTITVFSQKTATNEIRIWNHQLIRYAGYKTEQGEIIGDPDSIAFTEVCINLGWTPKYGHFDVLPLVIQINQRSPKCFEIPVGILLEVPISHPHFDWFEDLQIKWYSVPIISSMSLEIGGITYTAAPFNGWYMGTEIGARNLADEQRYNMLPMIGSLMGLDTKSNISLWKDRALLELNLAVLHSYKVAKVSIVDHHTAAQQFKKFEEMESAKNRAVTGNWSWLVPPLAPATTHIFHKPYKNNIIKPNYFNQKRPY